MSTRLSVAAMLLGLTIVPAAAERRGITEKDLFGFAWVADPQMAPDGTQVAFVRVTVDETKDAYATAIWIAKTDGAGPPRALTNGPRDTSPRWSPDGRQLAFVRSTEKEGKPEPSQIYVMPLGPGEPRAITDLPKGAGAPEWSPDGKTIAFSSSTNADDLAERKKAAEAAKPVATQGEAAAKPHKSDVRVITQALYRANEIPGTGFIDREHPPHLWTVAVPASAGAVPEPKQITTGEFPEANSRWAKDGSRLFFISDRKKESYYDPEGSDNDLYSVSKEGGEVIRVADIAGPIVDYALSPDGTRIAFVGALSGNPERSFSQPDLWVVDVRGGTPRNLTDTFDFDIEGEVLGDQKAPRGEEPSAPIWTADGKAILVKVANKGNVDLAGFNAQTGRLPSSGHFTEAPHEVVSYTADRSSQRIAMTISTPTSLGDLYLADGATGERPRRLTTFNDDLFNQLALSEPEEIWYTSFDGKKIQGWILKPPSFDPSKKYPLILEIHGGPHAAYGNNFTHEFQWMAAKGYVVLYVNPRGSSNYGQDFGNSIQFAYPGDDYKDLMAGVDEVLKRGYVDPTRLGVTGGSGGGLLTNWTVTQTTRFKAAVSQRDIADWTNFWYATDFTLFTASWFHKAPFEDPADFARRSPITHVANIQTPLMFILGDEDFRTPPGAGGEDLFRALKYLKRPTVMVRFPNENHELSRSGKPWHRIERLEHILGWFDKWLV
jgi:dipeptidyl aminopeptidase/acylaminoacyl peptidase